MNNLFYNALRVYLDKKYSQDSLEVYKKLFYTENEIRKNQFSVNYGSYAIYGTAEDSLGLKLKDIYIYEGNKLAESISYSLNSATVKITKNKYTRTDVYDVNTKSCLSSYTQDNYFSDVLVGKSYDYTNGKVEITDWDILFPISDKELLKILPDRFSQGVELKMKKLEKTTFTDKSIKDSKIYYLSKSKSNLEKSIKVFIDSRFSQNNEIRFEKIIHEGVGYWMIYYGSYILGLRGDGRFYAFEARELTD